MDTSDNRRQRLFMKDAGRKLYKRYIPMLREREQSRLPCLSAAERNQLDTLLDKLNRHVASLARQRDLKVG
jgi:DNA-binding MarR family transcriptional regulator